MRRFVAAQFHAEARRHPSVWTEAFELEDEDLEKLYTLMWAKGVFAENWRQSEELPEGYAGGTAQVFQGGPGV